MTRTLALLHTTTFIHYCRQASQQNWIHQSLVYSAFMLSLSSDVQDTETGAQYVTKCLVCVSPVMGWGGWAGDSKNKVSVSVPISATVSLLVTTAVCQYLWHLPRAHNQIIHVVVSSRNGIRLYMNIVNYENSFWIPTWKHFLTYSHS